MCQSLVDTFIAPLSANPKHQKTFCVHMKSEDSSGCPSLSGGRMWFQPRVETQLEISHERATHMRRPRGMLPGSAWQAPTQSNPWRCWQTPFGQAGWIEISYIDNLCVHCECMRGLLSFCPFGMGWKGDGRTGGIFSPGHYFRGCSSPTGVLLCDVIAEETDSGCSL